MKKVIIVIVLLCLTLPGCDPDMAICYDCTKTSTVYSKFCLPRSEAKTKKENLEKDGYNCKKFKQ